MATVRIFGSHARGDAGPESDVDVLVVVEDLTPGERRVVFDLAWDVFPEREIYISPLALSTREWAELVAREYRIAVEIQAEGVDA